MRLKKETEKEYYWIRINFATLLYDRLCVSVTTHSMESFGMSLTLRKTFSFILKNHL